MQLVDTHCHLDFPQYKDDREEVIKRAEDSGVVRMVVPGTDVASSKKASELARKHSGIFFAAGIHPHEADKVGDSEVSKIRDMAIECDKIVAVGEIGLDYYRKYADPDNQKKLFRDLLLLAKELDLPVILHNREAGEDFFKILKEVFPSGMKGVMHCFSGDEAFLKKVLEMGLYVSFAGNITFAKAAGTRELIESVPIERLLLETDAPYISPEPYRGKRNEPAYVRNLVDIYAKAYGLSAEDIASITTSNADRLFRLGLDGMGTVTYAIRDSLYLNMTYRCTNRCSFCTRNVSDYVKGYNLKLDGDPPVDQIISAMGDISKYDEIVFCGFGEPTLRLGAVKRIAAYVKEKGGKVRMVTNGEGALIAKRPIAGELEGLIDRVSVSLNSADEAAYERICSSVFGKEARGAAISFIKGCNERGIKVEITCLELPGEDVVPGVRRLAEELGVDFRLRYLDNVG